MAYHTSAMTTPTASTTGTLKRTVADKIRHLFPGNPFMALIESGLPDSGVTGKGGQKKGLISKRKVMTPKYEAFTYTPMAVEFTVATWSSITSFTLSSVDGLSTYQTVVNTRNHTVARIGAITVATKTLQATSIGDTTFSAAAGDKLLVLGPAYPENSSSPQIIMKDEDNLYNFTQTFRFPAAVSSTAGGNAHYGGDYWSRVKKRVVVEGLRRVTHAMFYSERASGTNETTTDSILSDTVRTMRGIYNWAGASYPAGGSMTFSKFQNEMALAMNDTVGDDTKLVMACGTRIWADILGWENDKLTVLRPGSYDKFGVESKVLLTARAPVEVLKLDIFDRGSLNKEAIIFNPDDLEYIYKNKGPKDKQDRDFQPRLGIEDNSVDGVEDEIYGEVSICPKDGGNNIMTISNWW